MSDPEREPRLSLGESMPAGASSAPELGAPFSEFDSFKSQVGAPPPKK